MLVYFVHEILVQTLTNFGAYKAGSCNYEVHIFSLTPYDKHCALTADPSAISSARTLLMNLVQDSGH